MEPRPFHGKEIEDKALNGNENGDKTYFCKSKNYKVYSKAMLLLLKFFHKL